MGYALQHSRILYVRPATNATFSGSVLQRRRLTGEPRLLRGHVETCASRGHRFAVSSAQEPGAGPGVIRSPVKSRAGHLPSSYRAWGYEGMV